MLLRLWAVLESTLGGGQFLIYKKCIQVPLQVMQIQGGFYLLMSVY